MLGGIKLIIMINGPFGVGKTSAASALCEKLTDFMIFDPEEIGFMLRNIVTDDVKYPSEKTGDFQDIILWKELTAHIAERLISTYNKSLIIPMTVHNTGYFKYIINELQKFDRVRHFCLLAQRKTIEERLSSRGEQYGTWAFNQIDKCLNSFENNKGLFHQILYTDNLSVSEICDCIIKNSIGQDGSLHTSPSKYNNLFS